MNRLRPLAAFGGLQFWHAAQPGADVVMESELIGIGGLVFEVSSWR